jgi:hypothetical protein
MFPNLQYNVILTGGRAVYVQEGDLGGLHLIGVAFVDGLMSGRFSVSRLYKEGSTNQENKRMKPKSANL